MSYINKLASGRRGKEWEDCTCGNKVVHSPECKRNHRKKYLRKFLPSRKEERHRLRKEHRCIWCGKKATPIIVYPQFCPHHKKQQAEYNRKLRERLKNDNKQLPEVRNQI